KIDITPLLRTMESRFRTSVRRATADFNAVGFPYYDQSGNYHGSGFLASGRSQAAAIGDFFNHNQPYGLVGCDDAATLMLSQGLIKVIGSQLYDEVLAR